MRLVRQGDRGALWCNSARRRGKKGIQSSPATPRRARQPSCGWALWYILHIFHDHPSRCDPTRGPFMPLTALRRKTCCFSDSMKSGNKDPRVEEKGAAEPRCAPGPPGSGHKQMLGQPSASQPNSPLKGKSCRWNGPEMDCFGPPLRQRRAPPQRARPIWPSQINHWGGL